MSDTYLLSPNDWLGIFVRLSIALLAGGIIGLEREIRDKPAGLRTHMLVSFGSALFTLVPILIGDAQRSSDALARVIQGISAGIGFVGGGVILRESQASSEGFKVRGLTSAAAVWVSAALGLAAGCGLWQLSVIAAGVTLVVLKVVKTIESRL